MGSSATQLSAVADELICSADLHGHLTDANPAFTRHLGWTEAELVNTPYIDFVHPDDQEATRAAVDSLSTSGRMSDFRSRWRRKDGSYAWIDWRAYLHEQAIYAIGTVRAGDADREEIELVVTRVIRQQALEDELRQREREAEREAERSNQTGMLMDAEHRANVEHTRAKTLRVWVGAAIAVATTIGGSLTWAVNRLEQNAIRAREAEERREKVDEEILGVNGRVSDVEKKINRVGESMIETQVQVSDSTDYISDKIEMAHPRTKKVERPPSVKRAKIKADEIKKSRAMEELFQAQHDDFTDEDSQP